MPVHFAYRICRRYGSASASYSPKATLGALIAGALAAIRVCLIAEGGEKREGSKLQAQLATLSFEQITVYPFSL